jgi:hypothetical protein
MMSEDTVDARVQQAWDDSFDRQVLRDVLPGLNVHPDDVITLLRYAPLALTHLTWRNTVLEDWHVEGRIHDPDMFRTNADTTLIFQQALWSAFGEQIGSGDLACLDDLTDEEDGEAFEAALYDACAEGFRADRRLPNGMALSELAQGELNVLQEHASTQIGALAAKAGELGVDVVLMFLAIRGRLACDRWWGSPKWPAIVDKFIALLRDPTDGWWHVGHRPFPTAWPAETADLDHLRHLLLSRPYLLSYEAADFCVDNALGFVQVDR